MTTVGPPRPPEPAVVAAVALGGVIGAEARYGLALLASHRMGTWPWATLVTNLAGCLLIGVLVAVLAGRTAPRPLARPFLGVGILGGFTTFSAFALESDALLRAHRPGAALAYVLLSVAGCLAATVLGGAITRRLLRRQAA